MEPYRGGNNMVVGITVNIGVADLRQTTRFMQSLGFEVDPMFAAEDEMELIHLGNQVYVMLNTESRFESISRKPIANSHEQAEAVFQLRVGSRQDVDEIVDRALAASATPIHEPNDQGFIYGRSFQDPDGHNWDCFWAAHTGTA